MTEGTFGRLKHGVRGLVTRLRGAGMSYMPTAAIVISYSKAAREMRTKPNEEVEELREQFLAATAGKRCLQIGVKEGYAAKFGPNWVSVDLYDMRDFIDYHYDIVDLKFSDADFDAIYCQSILEHVPDPQRAIGELYRVLRPGGAIWMQLPFVFPFHEYPKDYWRVSPDGLRIWMRDFKELSCGTCFMGAESHRTLGKALTISTYFHGVK